MKTNEATPFVQRSILSASALRTQIISNYDLPDPVTCEFWNHSINDTYVIQAEASKFFLRVAPANWRCIEQINAEIDLLQFLNGHNISVPQPISTRNGDRIQTINAPEGDRYTVLFSSAPGTPVHEMTQSISHQFGSAVAQLHQVTNSYPQTQPLPVYDLTEMLDRSLKLIEPLFTDQRNDFEHLLHLSSTLKQVTGRLPIASSIFGICHGDLNASNFHEHDNGNWSLVDFEYTGYGWRIFDIATFFNTQLVDRSRTDQIKDVLDSFLAGYQEVRKLTSTELEALPAFVILRQIWLLGTSARYIPKSTVGAEMHRQWIFQQVMPFIRKWTDDPGQFE